jgi:hypothetical protein
LIGIAPYLPSFDVLFPVIDLVVGASAGIRQPDGSGLALVARRD